jgi:hypothetical protein
MIRPRISTLSASAMRSGNLCLSLSNSTAVYNVRQFCTPGAAERKLRWVSPYSCSLRVAPSESVLLQSQRRVMALLVNLAEADYLKRCPHAQAAGCGPISAATIASCCSSCSAYRSVDLGQLSLRERSKAAHILRFSNHFPTTGYAATASARFESVISSTGTSTSPNGLESEERDLSQEPE